MAWPSRSSTEGHLGCCGEAMGTRGDGGARLTPAAGRSIDLLRRDEVPALLATGPSMTGACCSSAIITQL